ncbi:MAG TPA: hypothetical protein DCR97_07330 [Deltaproteobacteria bacterium]|nr:hypothetical protein [Deltaproteobacteria bacterium]
MNISYCFASAKGDILIDEAVLDRKFSTGPSRFHEFLTLRDFFDCVKGLLVANEGAAIRGMLSQVLDRPVKIDEIEGIVIRYEKYGTLYQVCSVHAAIGDSLARICVTVALADVPQQILEQEYALLEQFREDSNLGYLPRVYRKDWAEASRAGQSEKFLVVFSEWFEGYDEWHFQSHEGVTKAFVWDMRNGYRYLSEEQTFDLICQASRILTLYYDVETGRRIMPWHHGAGDFVVNVSETGLDVKLITVRGYEPINCPGGEKDPLRSLCIFCLETLTRMRIDKWEGMEESTWADPFVVEAAMKGFIQGLKAKETEHALEGLSVAQVIEELRSFPEDRMKSVIKEGFVDLEGYKSPDYVLISWNLERHMSQIRDALWKLTG